MARTSGVAPARRIERHEPAESQHLAEVKAYQPRNNAGICRQVFDAKRKGSAVITGTSADSQRDQQFIAVGGIPARDFVENEGI